ncbi:DUF4392 domain-containing protein [Mycolicibacterium llatzerense]
METAHVLLLTGFYLPLADPPTAETDGPLGAVMLARAVELLGGIATIVTDEPCQRVVQAAAVAARLSGQVMASPLGADYGNWEARLQTSCDRRPTHVIAIERVGPSYRGTKLNMRGQNIDAFTAPLERILQLWNTYSIGIGDGGNEIGMGCIERDTIAAVVPRGADIACSVATNALIVGGTSNWGAYALTAAMRLLGEHQVDEVLEIEWSHRILNAIMRAGGADGVTLQRQATVDGLSLDEYCLVLRKIQALVNATVRR